MSRALDLAIVGAGPAGLAAAVEAAALDLRVLLLDEQDAPGGQIYRAVEATFAERANDAALLGGDYARGLELVTALRKSAVEYRPGSMLWHLGSDGAMVVSGREGTEVLEPAELLLSVGAMERAVPIPGWTLPGVMSAGAAQALLKSSGLVPDSDVYLAGNGPLLLLVAAQLVQAGAPVRAVLETTGFARYAQAARHLPAAIGHGYLRKGLAYQRALRAAGVPIVRGVRALRALGEDRLREIRYRRGRREHRARASWLLLHQGVVPNVQLTRALECEHAWDAAGRYWRPSVDSWGRLGSGSIAVAGDCGGIVGAAASELQGRLAALEIARRCGRLTRAQRDERAAPCRRSLRAHLRVRPFLDALYPPEITCPPDDTLVCRCEEVSAGEVREAVRIGCLGPNQVKSFTRCGMGPCQGRLCGLTVSEIIARTRGVEPSEVGYYRVRPPIKPVTLGELAGLDAAALEPRNGRAGALAGGTDADEARG